MASPLISRAIPIPSPTPRRKGYQGRSPWLVSACSTAFAHAFLPCHPCPAAPGQALEQWRTPPKRFACMFSRHFPAAIAVWIALISLCARPSEGFGQSHGVTTPTLSASFSSSPFSRLTLVRRYQVARSAGGARFPSAPSSTRKYSRLFSMPAFAASVVVSAWGAVANLIDGDEDASPLSR